MIPLQLKVIEEYQEVIALDRPDATTTMIAAQRPPALIRSFAGTSLLAYLTVSRFADHLPYYRQENILGRSGLYIDRSTQWRWMRRLAKGVTPLVDLMWDRARHSLVIAMDETPVKELGGLGTTLKGYLWCGVGDADHPYDCFFYSSDRRRIRPESYLAGFRGYLLADAYVAYERIGQLWPDVTKASCWRTVVASLRNVITWERRSRRTRHWPTFGSSLIWKTCTDKAVMKSGWPHGKTSRSRSSMRFMNGCRVSILARCPKRNSGAINYMLSRWKSFTCFLESGMVPLDNNAAERALKYPILGARPGFLWATPRRGKQQQAADAYQDVQPPAHRSVCLSARCLCASANDVAG